jgi:hypothetical protein
MWTLTDGGRPFECLRPLGACKESVVDRKTSSGLDAVMKSTAPLMRS